MVTEKKMKTISLIMPVSKFYSSNSTNVPPYALLYVGSALKKAGYNVKIYHENGNVDNVVDKVLADDNLFVGISAFTGYAVWMACQYAKRIKERSPNTKIVIGGYHVTLLPEQVMKDPWFDFAVVGEGEKTVVGLANSLSNGDDYFDINGLWWKSDGGDTVNIGDPRDLLDNIDIDIDWSLIDLDKYTKRVSHLDGKKYFYIFSSRGCNWDCSFCAGSYIHKRRYRKESADHVIKQYKPLLDKYGIELVEYLDDNFFVDIEWAEKVATGIDRPYRALLRLDRINENLCDILNRTNCRAIFVGIESGNEHVRNDIIRKHLTDDQIYNAIKMLNERCPHINISAMFIAGIPGEKYDEFIDTCRMAIKLTDMHKKLLPQLNVYTPYPLCDSYLDAVKNGWISPKRTEDWVLDPKPGKGLEPVWLDYYDKKLADKFRWAAVMFVLLRQHEQNSFMIKNILKILRYVSKFRLKNDFYWFPVELRLFWYFYMKRIREDVV